MRLKRWLAVMVMPSLVVGMIAAGSAFGATYGGPPVKATTGAAYPITATEELLTGSINDGGTPVKWQFEYGLTTSYGSFTLSPSLPASTGTQTVAVLISRLKPRTVYHYRIVAIEGNGVRIPGQDATFKSSGTGLLLLNRSKLTAHSGQLKVPLKCASSINCRGKFTITTTVRSTKTKQATKMICVSGARYTITAQKTKTVRARLVKRCAALLKAKKQLKAKLTSFPPTDQHALIKNIRLIYHR